MLGLFSERNKEETENKIFIYDELPKSLRKQLKSILERILNGIPEEYSYIHRELSEEYGVESLYELYFNPYSIKRPTYKYILLDFIIYEEDIGKVFDLIELAFRRAKMRHDDKSVGLVGFLFKRIRERKQRAKMRYDGKLDDITNRINTRFRESSVGYELVDGKFIRIDSEFTFNKIIEPTLNLTTNNIFKNVNHDFLEAIKDYQDEKNEDCIIKRNKAFESTMKIICDKKDWKYKEKDRASQLINICLKNNIIPEELQSEFNNLKGLLESGTPAIRNNFAAHGSGNTKRDVPNSLARYTLNLTGSNILYLIESSGL